MLSLLLNAQTFFCPAFLYSLDSVTRLHTHELVSVVGDACESFLLVMSLPITQSVTIDQVIDQFVSFSPGYFLSSTRRRQLTTFTSTNPAWRLIKYLERKISMLKGASKASERNLI